MKKISLFLILLAAFVLAPTVWAGTVSHIEILDYGPSQVEMAGQKSSDQDLTYSQKAKITKTSDEIAARPGATFGLLFKVCGQPQGEAIPLEFKFSSPRPGGEPGRTRGDYTLKYAIGRSVYNGFILRPGWDQAYGIWTMKIYYQGRLLAEKSFNLYKKSD